MPLHAAHQDMRDDGAADTSLSAGESTPRSSRATLQVSLPQDLERGLQQFMRLNIVVVGGVATYSRASRLHRLWT